MSETRQVRPYVEKYCRGKGVDVGCGSEKITPDAIGIDFAIGYDLPDHPATAADVTTGWEDYFAEAEPHSLDYIFSSHLLEDYEDIEPALRAWLPALKPGAYLILFLPIEELYERHCEATGQTYNKHHQQDYKGAEDFLGQLPDWVVEQMKCVEKSGVVGEYSFYVVLKKVVSQAEPS